MGFRFRKRLKLFPGVSLNFSKRGISSLSFGGPGATVNVPIAREGQTRTTVGLPGTGLSYSQEGSKQRSVRERRQAQNPRIPSTEEQIQNVMSVLVGPGTVGGAFWDQGLVAMVLESEEAPRKVREAALLLKSPESAELHMRRARGKVATLNASSHVLEAAQLIIDWTQEMGWSEPGEG